MYGRTEETVKNCFLYARLMTGGNCATVKQENSLILYSQLVQLGRVFHAVFFADHSTVIHSTLGLE